MVGEKQGIFGTFLKLPSSKTALFSFIVVSLGIYCMPGLLGAVSRAFGAMAESYISGSASMAFVTVPNMDVAKKLARGIVQEKLAACVNIMPGITSVYEWENKINEDSELLLMIKTQTSKIDSLSAYVREHHPYDCPEVIASKIDNGNLPYMKWIADTVVPSSGKKQETIS